MKYSMQQKPLILSLIGLSIAITAALPVYAQKPFTKSNLAPSDDQFLNLVDQYLLDDRNELIDLSAEQKVEDAQMVCQVLDDGETFVDLRDQIVYGLANLAETNELSTLQARDLAYYWGVIGAVGVTVYCPEYSQQLSLMQ